MARRIESDKARKREAKARAEAAVDAWDDAAWSRSLFSRAEKKAAVDEEITRFFGRNAARVLRAEEAALERLDRVLEIEGAQDRSPRAVSEARMRLVEVVELLEAGALNSAITLSGRLKEVLHRAPLKYVGPHVFGPFTRPPRGPAADVPAESASRATEMPASPTTPAASSSHSGVIRDDRGETVDACKSISDSSRIDPVAPSFWRVRSRVETCPAALHRGPWFAPDEAPKLPAPSEVLRLGELRSFEATGTHPSVEVVDARDQVWKVKFHANQPFLEEPIVTRLHHALGWNTLPKFAVPGGRLLLDPRAVLGADLRAPKSRILGIRVRNEYHLEDYVDALVMKDGRRLERREAVTYLRRAQRARGWLDDVQHVSVKNFDLTFKSDGAKAVGPWNPDALSHPEMRAVRALAMMSSWLLARDYKTSNFRLDLVKGALVHGVSDLGMSLEPRRLGHISDRVGASPTGCWHHDNANQGRLDAFDRMTVDDARWALRKLGTLSEDQLLACFAASEAPRAVVRFLFERFIARRDDLVERFGLVGELGRLRPPGASLHLDVPDADEEVVLPGHGPQSSVTVVLRGDGYALERGRLTKDGAPLFDRFAWETLLCPSSDPPVRL